MKTLTGKKLYAAAFVCDMIAIIAAVLVSNMNAMFYHIPMFLAAFAFAALFYRANMPHMWGYLLIHLVAYAGYTVAYMLAVTGSLAVPGASGSEILQAVIFIAVLCSASVVPVCVAYRVYVLIKKRQKK